MRKPEDILGALLEIRGISSEEEIEEFLSDRPQKTYDPFLLLNMEAGVDLLLSEIKNNTRICIYGDYDADGVTSVCILSHVLSMLTENYTYYIPSRFDEGYGLNKEAIKKVHETGVGLIITVDCGSVSWEEVEYAKELGMKVIVTDHHSIDDVKADCILINPKQQECRYPFKSLAGCGVAFKMAQAILQKSGLPRSAVNDVLDLAAIGTVGDVVSLTDENRTIVKYGLNKINSGSRESLAKLCRAISLKWISSENIAFGIAPHINAAGRMAGAAEAVELFTSKDEAVIEEKVGNLVYYNGQRKKKQEAAYNQGMKMIRGDENFIVLQMDDIHEGIGGIVAGKIKETTGRPVIIVTPSGEDYLKGTGRSTDGVDIYGMLKEHSSLFERFGGHSKACGFLMKKENLPALRAALDDDIVRLMSEDDSIFQKTAAWDMELRPEEITMELVDMLTKLEPVGEENPRPSFIIRNVELKRVQFMGADRTHARFTALSEEGKSVECILFKKAQEIKGMLQGGEKVDIIGFAEAKSWIAQKKVQFIVEEIIGCR